MTQTETTKDRLMLILGEEGLARLDRACVMVIGLGGVGSNCVEALARGGVGNLVLLDRDVVAPSNVKMCIRDRRMYSMTTQMTMR